MNLSVSILVAMLVASPYVIAQDLPPAPWRQSDTTLVQICFDDLGNSAPKRLSLRAVSDGSTSSSGIDLIGLTLTGRPIYQGAITHPLRYRSVLVQLPNSELWARIDKPDNLEKYIDIWRDAPISGCTEDRQAAFKILRTPQDPVEPVACPAIGINVSIKVTSYSEQAVEQIHLKANGPKSFNGLRGCREFVYAQPK